MADPNPNPSPKVRFLSSAQNIKDHRAMVDKPEFDRASQTALLEYQRQLCEQKVDMSGAAANHFKLIGAQEIMHVLRLLSEVPALPKSQLVDNLDHRS